MSGRPFGKPHRIGVLVLLVLAGGSVPGNLAAQLVSNGASEYCIVLAPEASPSEKFAAEELQSHFEACTGVKLPIVHNESDAGKGMIVLGCGAVAEGLGVKPDPDALGEQGYVMRTVAPHLVIAGTPMVGTLYGVYDFLEDQLGVRWYAPGDVTTPDVGNLVLPEVDMLVKPALYWRCTSYEWRGHDEAFLARQRLNRGTGGPEHRYGIQHIYDGASHSYFKYVSPNEFWDTHPEYFSEIGGVRRRKNTQLCLTNPDVLEIVAQRMLEGMKAAPEIHQYRFSQMDWYNGCECSDCAAMNKKYGTAGGTQFWFVNELAKRTSESHPDKLISTLAYMYTEEPPVGLEMHPNACVWLCHMFPSCDSHPVAICPRDADFKRRVLAWSKICSHLYIWHYMVNFAHYYIPYPNFRAMASDLRFYRDNGIEGVYLQGMQESGGFALLRAYYGMKLSWNPDRDADIILWDFLEGYYGAAAEALFAYITLLHDRVEDEDIHMHLYTNPAQGYLSDDVLAEAGKLFDKAEEAVADNETLLERVRVARMPLAYAGMFPRNGYEVKDGFLRFKGPFASFGEIGAFFARMEKHGFQRIREVLSSPKLMAKLAVAVQAGFPAPRIENELLSVDAVPALGGRALRIIHKASGKCITSHNCTRSLVFPFCGGDETRYGGVFRPAGFFDQYQLAEKSSSAMVMRFRGSPFEITRRLELLPDKPVLKVTVTFRNVSETPQEFQLRSHMELDLGPIRDTRFHFRNRAGQQTSRSTGPIIADMRQGEHYYDEDAPQGAWVFSGAKGLEVTQRFDDAKVDFTWVYAYPEELNGTEVEVWALEQALAPEETWAFAYEYEVVQCREQSLE